MTINDRVTKAIRAALEQAGILCDGDITIEHPRDLSHGDFATNIAMVVAKAEGKNPHELAENIAVLLARAKFNPVVPGCQTDE